MQPQEQQAVDGPCSPQRMRIWRENPAEQSRAESGIEYDTQLHLTVILPSRSPDNSPYQHFVSSGSAANVGRRVHAPFLRTLRRQLPSAM